MPGLAMVFDILAVDRASGVFQRVGGSAAAAGREVEASSGKMSTAMASFAKGGALAAAAFTVVAVKMAGDFQQSVTKLATTAGESQKNLKMVGQGMLDMAGQVGIGANDLAKGMYMVESSGIHGADALKVLKAAAQGAKQEQADLSHVTDAVTTSLHDYHLPASMAATVTSQLISAVSHGKTTFDELTGAMHSVEPIASAVGMTIAQTAGALAAMTASGMHADQAAQNLASSIRSLSKPTQPMINEMAQLGLTASDLSAHLGERGVAGTLQIVSDAIMHHMGPAGRVLLDTMNQSTIHARDAQVMFNALPPALQKLATEYKSGAISVGDYRKAFKGLPADQGMLIQSWKVMQDRANGFSNVLKTGGPDVQTYIGALGKAVGTSEGLSVALQLTGANAASTNQTIKDVGRAVGDTSGNIKGWAEVQGNLNQQLDEAKHHIGAMTIEFGQHLLPVLTSAFGYINRDVLPGIEKLGSGVGSAAHWFGELPGPIKAVAEAMAGLALANAIGLFTKLGNGIVYARVLMLEFAGVTKGSMASVAASYRGAAAAAGELAAVQGSAGLRSAVSGIAGLGAAAGTTAKVGFGALRSAGSGLISMLGGPWVVGIAAAVGAVYLINKSVQDHTKQVQAATASVQKWQEALAFGSGGQVRDAASHINDITAKIAALQAKIDIFNAAAKGGYARGGIGTLISQMHDLQAELNGGTDAWKNQLAAMTPVQEGQAKVAIATDEVNKALKSGNADQIAAAYEALARANTFLAGETNKDAQAQKSANQQLQDAATLAIGARDAALGYRLSQLDLKSAIADVAKGQADGTLKGDALAKAQLQLAQQVENVAKAAGDAAVAQANASGVTETGTLRSQAMIDVLRDQAKHLTGPAHDAIMGYIADLAKSTTETTVGTKAMTNLGLTVDKLPAGHFIKIEAPTEKQMKDLHDLAYFTLTLPDGHVIVSANVKPAEDEIRKMISDYRTQVIDLRAQMPALNAGTSQRMGTYATGGYTGDGGKFTPAGIVHAGEFVFPQESVSKLGVGFLGALAGLPGYASGGYAPNGTMPVGWIRPTVHMDTKPIADQFAAMVASMKAAAAGPGGAPSNVSGNAATVQRVAAQYGWNSGAEWNALYNVIMRESGFRNTAQNPTSSAYGMFQFLDSTWAGYGVSKTSDALFQSVAGLAYIKSRYGDPLGAYRHEQSMGWYEKGTNYVPKDGPAYLHKGEAVVPAHLNKSGGGGPVIVNIYDVDNKLLGSMEGVVAGALTGATIRGTYNP